MDILLDLAEAVGRANLTNRQRQVIELVYGEDLTQKEAGERLGIGQDSVSHCVKGALKRITKVYREWEYGEVTATFDEDNEINEEESDE